MLGRFSAYFDKDDSFLTPISVHQPPSQKGSTLKGKNLLPSGANSFLLE